MVIEDVYNALKDKIEKSEITVEIPTHRNMGDLAVPCFSFSKKLRKNPNDIADYIKEHISEKFYEKVEVVNGYLNFFINKKVLTKYIINKILSEKSNYGNNNNGRNKKVVIDYSAPNIAKPFGIGHLRSTVIGNAIKNIMLKNGYNVISINHLGDWGTQFGKLICAYKKWGNDELLADNPIIELNKLYVKFHEEAEKNPTLEDEARKYFKDLEDGDKSILELWELFRNESLKEFKKTYELLQIKDFDSYNGEAFYNDKMASIISELEANNLLTISEGASVVELEDMPPALIKKSDGATLYITRDLAAAFYRKKTYDFDKALYVVGNEQTLHFKQLKLVIAKMGHNWYRHMHHINFGMILQDGKKMSTRRGKTVLLHDVLLEAIEMAKSYVDENRDLNIIDVSRQIGIGAVIFNDLKNYRANDIEFNLEEILNFNGETGPYIQYTYARINSLLVNKKNMEINYDKINISTWIWNIIYRLNEFPEIIIRATDNFDPSLIAKYALMLAQDFNKFYGNEKIIDEDENNSEFKLIISEIVAIVLKECLRLLTIEAPEKM